MLFLCVNSVKGGSWGWEERANGSLGLWNLNSIVDNAVWFLVGAGWLIYWFSLMKEHILEIPC